jgi:hypothetical protein
VAVVVSADDDYVCFLNRVIRIPQDNMTSCATCVGGVGCGLLKVGVWVANFSSICSHQDFM